MDSEFFSLLIILGFSFFFLLLGLLVGKARERAHLASLQDREDALREIAITSLKEPMGALPGSLPPCLLTGEAAIASDYFKTWISSLRTLFGGELGQYTGIYGRARREALTRLMEKAQKMGYNAICNVRYDSADLGGNSTGNAKKQMPMAVCLVSATAYVKG